MAHRFDLFVGGVPVNAREPELFREPASSLNLLLELVVPHGLRPLNLEVNVALGHGVAVGLELLPRCLRDRIPKLRKPRRVALEFVEARPTG
jgi:hypothetical protein